MGYLEHCYYSNRLIEKLKLLDTENKLDFPLINKAIYWAKKYHDGQFRKSGEPFYTHPLEVAYMVSDYNLKTDVIVTSILHDIIEDTEVMVEMIADNFGWRIAEMVDRLTRDRPNGSKSSVEEILNNAYEKNDKEVLLIKVIDRLHNMQTISSKSQKKIEHTVQETINNFLYIVINFEMLEVENQMIEISSKTIFTNQSLIERETNDLFLYYAY